MKLKAGDKIRFISKDNAFYISEDYGTVLTYSHYNEGEEFHYFIGSYGNYWILQEIQFPGVIELIGDEPKSTEDKGWGF